jgi:hypothetical protein
MIKPILVDYGNQQALMMIGLEPTQYTQSLCDLLTPEFSQGLGIKWTDHRLLLTNDLLSINQLNAFALENADKYSSQIISRPTGSLALTAAPGIGELLDTNKDSPYASSEDSSDPASDTNDRIEGPTRGSQSDEGYETPSFSDALAPTPKVKTRNKSNNDLYRRVERRPVRTDALTRLTSTDLVHNPPDSNDYADVDFDDSQNDLGLY